MSEEDPYAEKRKERNDESRMDNESLNSPSEDTNPDISGTSRNPKDDVNPVRPRTNMPDQKTENDTENKL